MSLTFGLPENDGGRAMSDAFDNAVAANTGLQRQRDEAEARATRMADVLMHDSVRLGELEAEVDRLRLALRQIATRIPPPERDEEANWRWMVAYSALHDRPLPERFRRYVA
jgi:hypothetical protein